MSPPLLCLRSGIFAAASVLVSVACQSDPASDEADTDSALDSAIDDDGATEGADPTASAAAGVDILVVLDNSGSMGAAQAKLALALPGLVERFEEEGLDYRLAVTTTDNGNPICTGTTPESGRFVATSCLDRADDFVPVDNIDGGPVVCPDVCSLSGDDFVVKATSTAVDDAKRARPWLENIAGEDNFPEGQDRREILSCFLPQGISGCAYESPLEAMRRALIRAQDPEQAEYGFLRDDAALLVLIVSDETDCSYRGMWEEVFSGGENSPFIPEGEPSIFSGHVCWNAGVHCEGPSANLSCEAANKDIDGERTFDPEAAVLVPVQEYVDYLDGLRRAGRPVFVSGMVGVQIEARTPIYVDARHEPSPNGAIMIGPGCESYRGEQAASPPARLLTVMEEFSIGQPYSICAEQFHPLFYELSQSLLELP